MSRNEAPGTAKKGLFRIVFSRTGVILLLILAPDLASCLGSSHVSGRHT